MKRRTYYFLILVIILGLIAVRSVFKTDRREPGPPTIVRVLDGDTAVLDGGEEIRLLGIDTPEQGEPFADSAADFLAHLLLRKDVRLQYDFRKRDSYGRLLAYVYTDDTLLANVALVSEGLARVYLFPDDITNRPIIDRLIAAQRQALAANRGIWSVPVRPEDRYIGNHKTMRFHRPDCEGAVKIVPRNRIVFNTREAALYDGYSPCRTCRP